MLKSNRFLEKCSFVHLSQDIWLFSEKEMATDSSVLAWKISWSLAGYSPWGHKESDTTEQPNNLVFNWAGPEAKCAQANSTVLTPPRNLPSLPPHVLSLHSQFRQLGHLIMPLLCPPTVRTTVIPHLDHCHCLLMGPRCLPWLVSLDSA